MSAGSGTIKSVDIIWLACLCLLAPVGLGWAVSAGLVTLPATLPATGQLLVLLIAAPIIEELVFRGHLQPQLTTFFARKTDEGLMAHAAAIGVTSLIFAALHWFASPTASSWWVALPSLALGTLQARSGKWQFCAVLHSAFNAVWCLTIWRQGL